MRTDCAATARASRSNRWENCSLQTLIATIRFRRVSLARNTSPIAPDPMASRISYGPSRAWGQRHRLPLGGDRQGSRLTLERFQHFSREVPVVEALPAVVQASPDDDEVV